MAEATVNSDGQRSDVDPSFTHHYYNPRHYEQGAMILTFCHGFFLRAQFFPVLSKKILCNFCGIFSDTPDPPTLSHLVGEKNTRE